MKTLFEHLPRIFTAFKKRDQRRLRKLNDQVLKEASTDPTEVNLRLAIISYVLSKIVSKPRFLGSECEPCLRDIEFALKNLMRGMKSGRESQVIPPFSEGEKGVACLDKKDSRFVIDLVTKGKLKMAATFYAQGMSLGVASEMTGMEKQEILDYAGQTMMFDRLKDEKTIKERMRIARQLISE